MAWLQVARLRNFALPDDHPDHWAVMYRSETGGVAATQTAHEQAVFVNGRVVTNDDSPAVANAVRLMPDNPKDAASAALRVVNQHTRVDLLSDLGLWGALKDKTIDASAEGELATCSDPDVRANLLFVECPSTGAEYVLLVPKELKTAAEARSWVNLGMDLEEES